MQLEMNRYLNPAAADRPSANCDILKWWKEHCKEFPLLAKCARKYLCIQASSASSERTFSTGGSIVTYKRTKLDVENVHMLVYCKDNLSKVEITSRIYEDEEEQEAEEEFLEDETQVLVPGSAKIKHLGKGKKSQVSTDSTPSLSAAGPQVRAAAGPQVRAAAGPQVRAAAGPQVRAAGPRPQVRAMRAPLLLQGLYLTNIKLFICHKNKNKKFQISNTIAFLFEIIRNGI
jgi:hypothetical protein